MIKFNKSKAKTYKVITTTSKGYSVRVNQMRKIKHSGAY